MTSYPSSYPSLGNQARECMLSRSVVSDSLRPHGLHPARFLCPWDSQGKNTGVGCPAFLQGIFLKHGSGPRLLCLLHWQVGSLPVAPPGKPLINGHDQTTFKSGEVIVPFKSHLMDFPGGPLVMSSGDEGTHVPSLVWGDPTCHQSTKPIHQI